MMEMPDEPASDAEGHAMTLFGGSPFAGLTGMKLSILMALSAGTVFAADIPDPSVERWVSLGVGGILAATIFWFYRRQVDESNRRERENAEAYKVQAALMIVTLQDNSRATTHLSAAVTELRGVVSDSSREQRERYEADLRAEREGGRRAYDPSVKRNE